MASTAKRKTTMAKLNRERRLVEKRLEKQAKKLARKRASADQANEDPSLTDELGSPGGTQELDTQ